MITSENVRSFFRKISRFGLFIPLTSLCLTFGGKWIPRRMLVWFSNRRNKMIKQHILNIVGVRFSQGKSPEIKNPEVAPIWFCWMQGEECLPAIPKLCLASIRKHANNHPVKVITEKNCREYVELPDFVWTLYHQGKLKRAHFADIYRVSLLAKHGGLWLDATMFLNEDVDENIFKMPFYSIKTPPYGLFVSQCRWAVYCLGCSKDNVIMSNVRDMFYSYLSKESTFVDYFMFDQFISILYNELPIVKTMVDNVPYNNVNVNKLNARLLDPFDKDVYDVLCVDTRLFKLSWKTFSDNDLGTQNSFYDYLSRKTFV